MYVGILYDEHDDIHVGSAKDLALLDEHLRNLVEYEGYSGYKTYKIDEPEAYTIICNMSSECASSFEYASTLEEALALDKYFTEERPFWYTGTYIHRFNTKQELEAYTKGLEDANGWGGEPIYFLSIVDQKPITR